MDSAADRTGCESQYPSRLLGAHAEPLNEHEGLSLPPGERGDCVGDILMDLQWLLGIWMAGHSDESTSSDREVPKPLAVQIHTDAVDVSGWRVHRPHPVPAFVGSGHCLLSEFLGLGSVGRKHVEGSDQAPILSLKELLEVEAPGHVPESGYLHLHPANP